MVKGRQVAEVEKRNLVTATQGWVLDLSLGKNLGCVKPVPF